MVHEPPNIDHLPTSLADIIHICLAKDPKERPTPDDLLALLSSSRLSLRATVGSARRRHPRKLVAVAVAIATALSVAGGIYIYPEGKPVSKPGPAVRPITGTLHEQQAAVRPKGWALWEQHFPEKSRAPGGAQECLWANTKIICNMYSGSTVAYSTQSGKVVWAKNLRQPGVTQDFISPSPEDGLFYTRREPEEFSTQIFDAWDVATGKLRWSIKLSGFSGMTVGNNMAIIAPQLSHSTSVNVMALNAKRGTRLWVHSFDADSVNVDAFAAGVLIVSVYRHGRFDLVGVDPTSGERRWTHPLGRVPDDYVGDSQGRIVFSYGQPGTPNVAGIDLIDPHSGETQRIAIKTPDNGSLAVDGSTLFDLRVDGQLRAINTTTGAVLWTTKAGDDVRPQLVVANQHVYFQTLLSEISCRDARTGIELWRSAPRRDPNKSLAQDRTMAQVTVDKGMVYAISARDTLFAIAPPASSVPGKPVR